MEKRFQECSRLQKIWRYRWYIMIPIWFLRSVLFFGGYRNRKLIWEVLIAEAQLKMKWYYTMEEVFENLDNKIENYGKENK